MRSKILVVLIAVAVVGVSSAAMAKGGGGKGGGSGVHVGHFGHAHFDHRFRRNQFLLGGWGWDWGLGSGYGDNGYGNTTVFPQATPQTTGSIATGPCHWNTDTFDVPSSAGGSRQVQVVGCR